MVDLETWADMRVSMRHHLSVVAGQPPLAVRTDLSGRAAFTQHPRNLVMALHSSHHALNMAPRTVAAQHSRHQLCVASSQISAVLLPARMRVEQEGFKLRVIYHRRARMHQHADMTSGRGVCTCLRALCRAVSPSASRSNASAPWSSLWDRCQPWSPSILNTGCKICPQCAAFELARGVCGTHSSCTIGAWPL